MFKGWGGRKHVVYEGNSGELANHSYRRENEEYNFSQDSGS
jgi:hypothetical protein